MAKRLSENEKKIIVKSFAEGKSVDKLSQEFGFANSTIARHLKKNLGDEKYKVLFSQSKLVHHNKFDEEKNNFLDNKDIQDKKNKYISNANDYFQELSPITQFTEITPLNYEIENEIQKDLSSVPISEIDFPSIVYMIVDKQIELETKYLREYPDWQFLSQDELNRKTIEVYFDLKIAKRFCKKEQKVIKVPNTDVFKIVSPLLLNRGISRIVTADKLIAL